MADGSSISVDGLIQGLHHITLVTSNQEVNRRFYVDILGLRRVKYSVNQDDIFHRHLFYANEKATTGSAITFFEWPNLPEKKVGLGSPHHLAFTVKNVDVLPRWKSWLASNGVSTVGPLVRDDRISLYLRDPDGVLVEITTPNTENLSQNKISEIGREPSDVGQISDDMKLLRFNHASPVASDPEITTRFFEKFLGLKNHFVKPNPDADETRIIGVGTVEQPDFLRYISHGKAPDGLVGTGGIHHIAVAVEDGDDQLRVKRRLDESSIENSGIINRTWFKSLYFRDPDGNLLEVATKGPGYTVDEPADRLGTSLVLPAWLEPQRAEIETRLRQLDQRSLTRWPPKYPATPSKPEALVSNEEVG